MSDRLKKENDKPKRITYLVDFFRSQYGGTERQLGHLLTHLPYAGYSLQLISFQNSPFLKNEAPRLFPKVAIKTLGGQSDVSKSLPALVSLFSYLRINKPDIVHTFFPASNSFGVLTSRLAGIRTIISSRRDMGYNLTRKDIALLKISNRFVSCVVTNAKAVQERTVHVEGIPKTKTQVIYNGILLDDQNQLLYKRIQKKIIVGIVANLNRQIKRVDLFIKAASILHKDFPYVRFWVIGDGPLRKDLEGLASNLGLNSSLFFKGRRGDVPQLLKKMAVGVNCSDSEGFSNSIMEYMRAGLPVVATNVGGNSELVHHGKSGFLVPPNDASSLAVALRKLLKDHETPRRMGNAGQEFLKKEFPFNGMIQKTKEMYESFLF